jgi:hypothetical protein
MRWGGEILFFGGKILKNILKLKIFMYLFFIRFFCALFEKIAPPLSFEFVQHFFDKNHEI